MKTASGKRRPGEVRDAIVTVLQGFPGGATPTQVQRRLADLIGPAPASSIRSYLRLNTPRVFLRGKRGHYMLRETAARPYALRRGRDPYRTFTFGRATLILADCIEWLNTTPPQSIHAVVTDPPYGLQEYSKEQQAKLRNGKGGVWRIPPSFDGAQRSPVPRFTILTHRDLQALDAFFLAWGQALGPVLVPGANVVVASNPLLSFVVSGALARAGLERRGELVRLVMTMRGGDRPKAAHEDFPDISVMPRSMWEPWLLFRKPIEGRVQDNLRKWGTGGFRRPSLERPFGDVIASAPTHKAERGLAPHPSLKPQAFLRQLVGGVLPLGKGVILDPFAGSGSTLAAAEAVGYSSIGIEQDSHYFEMACRSIPKLANHRRGDHYALNL